MYHILLKYTEQIKDHVEAFQTEDLYPGTEAQLKDFLLQIQDLGECIKEADASYKCEEFSDLK